MHNFSTGGKRLQFSCHCPQLHALAEEKSFSLALRVGMSSETIKNFTTHTVENETIFNYF
jgi:hypothetical protein